ncbi:hypothetical protein ACSFXN_01285 [Planococcus sp. 1R117A]|uniref:hypothetical protein n=1 Tax=Planococcus sp. 1R117A TaxID=3447020 RepID=UPI003EDBA1DB
MKKLSGLVIAALLLSGCGTAVKESSGGTTNSGSGNHVSASEVGAVDPEGLQVYMPEQGLVKNFEVDTFEVVREVKQVEENKALEIITFGDVKTVQISEWTESTMDMLLETSELTGVKDLSLEGLVPMESPVSMINEANQAEGEWQITGTSETLETPAGTFEDVLVITQTLKSDTSDQVTTISNYYAPSLGLIQEQTTVTNGDNVHESKMELVSYE